MNKTKNKIFVQKLKKFNNNKGNIFMCYKEKVYDTKINIKEIYFTEIKYNEVKGWIRHAKISCNFTVPVGRVKFMFLNEKNSSKKEITIGEKNYKKIFVPSNTWFAFKGLSKKKNLVVNYLDKVNDNKDVLRKDFLF
tara:strand:+ start:3744 stop:4154 length:411 start_codon:yes stop_codon:yes gene_type:complete